ncbi:hypothetical protein [Actinomadura macrotermitis]|uniref:hypothetical protein n=1 Tax=Actinomadura macrotermitis TaxID=2585200 RepID=UPI0012966B76|nr:hypothetical protein [Actinomadura macrotermitis]
MSETTQDAAYTAFVEAALNGPAGSLLATELLWSGPGRLLKVLDHLGAVKQVPGAPGRYRFAYTARPGDPNLAYEPGGNRVSGSVEVAGGQVKVIDLSTTPASPAPGVADRNPVTRSFRIGFSDYGTPVQVEQP